MTKVLSCQLTKVLSCQVGGPQFILPHPVPLLSVQCGLRSSAVSASQILMGLSGARHKAGMTPSLSENQKKNPELHARASHCQQKEGGYVRSTYICMEYIHFPQSLFGIRCGQKYEEDPQVRKAGKEFA